MKTVKHGAPTERWLAVQCLAEYEHVDDCVIRQLLTHINGSDVVKSKKASELIKNLSCFTVSYGIYVLQHCVVAIVTATCNILTVLGIFYTKSKLTVRTIFIQPQT